MNKIYFADPKTGEVTGSKEVDFGIVHWERGYCKDCRFWSQEEKSCHRLPPQLNGTFNAHDYGGRGCQEQDHTAWPTAHADDWCGEWKYK